MSNPLRWFRRYERVMLGVFGVALMFIFTFSLGVGSIQDLFSGGPNGPRAVDQTEVVATWEKGDLRESDFEQLRNSRKVLMQYQQNLYMRAQALGSQGPQARPIPFNANEGQLLQLAVLSKQAEELGIEISDQSVLDYLTRFTAGKLKPSEFSNLWKNTTGFNDEQLLGLMRRELMAMQVQGMMQSGAYPASMLRKWEFYNRLERKINAEVMPIAVADYVAKVGDPTPAQVSTFFDKYKSQYAVPGDAEPGFRQREQAAFGSIQFDFEEFLEAELAAVSAEDVKKYYEENKDSFRELSFLEEDLTLEDLSVPDPDAAPGESNSNSESDTLESEADGTDREMSAIDDAETGNDAEASIEADREAGSLPTAEEEPQAEIDSSDYDADSDEATPVPTPTPVAQAAEEDESGAIKNKDVDLDASTPTESEAAAAMQTEAADQSAVATDEGPSESETELETSTPVESMTDRQSSSSVDDAVPAKPAGENAAAESTKEEGETAQAKYKPLEKVEDEIRRALARPLAQEKFNRALSEAQGRMKDYYRQQVTYSIQKGNDSDLQPPTQPDLSDIDGANLSIENIPLSDELTIVNYDIGKAFDMASDGSRFVMFSEVAFAKNQRPLYSPQQFPKSEAARTTFVYWITESQPAYTPELSEVREQVVAAWKQEQAVALAEAAAKEAVEKARAADKPLAESLGDMAKEFFETGNVSWLTGGNIPYDTQSVARATELVGFDSPGYDVYHTLFSTEEGDVGWATNESKSMVYVFRISEVSPDLEVLREGFVQNAPVLPALRDMRELENRRTLGEVYRGLLEANGIEWKREPADADGPR